MNSQTLDEFKQQIPLMGYLQSGLAPARRLARGRLMGLCPLQETTSRVSWWIPTKICFTAMAVAAAER